MNLPKPAEARLRLASEKSPDQAVFAHNWKVFIVDDEPEVHNVTKLALDGFHCHGRGIEFISAYSAKQARDIFQRTPDIALILLDVVMETEHAGLDLVKDIRETFKNQFVRIVLRTGQPGQAPEHKVITEYDINDYKHKTELTRQKLFTSVYTGISSYRDLLALDKNRRGLEKVINASAQIFDLRSLDEFADGVLDQLIGLLYLDQDALVVRASGLITQNIADDCEIVAATGRFAELAEHCNCSGIDEQARNRLQQARDKKTSILGQDYYVGRHQDEKDVVHYLYVSAELPINLQDRHLIDLFIRNVSIAYSNVQLLCEARHGEDEK